MPNDEKRSIVLNTPSETVIIIDKSGKAHSFENPKTVQLDKPADWLARALKGSEVSADA